MSWSPVADGVPAELAAEVVTLDDMSEVAAAVRALAQRFGRPERIVALSEFDLLVAAQLRAEFGIAGDRPDYVLRFRDKLVMGEAVRAAGVSAPDFRAAPDAAAVTEFAREYGYPLIVKPRLGAGSAGILKLDGPADLVRLPDLAAEPYLVQVFCPDGVGAVDGVWTGTELGAWSASAYRGACLEFANGGASLGYIEIDDAVVLEALKEFSTSVLIALSNNVATVFHLELFLSVVDGVVRPRFLEVAARIAGGETTHMWREVHGHDLAGSAVDAQLGRPLAAEPLTDGWVVGELLIHPPVTPPCTVVATHLDVSREYAPYHLSVPAPGTEITETFGYVDIGAAFRFRGRSTAEVTEAVRHTVAGFRMDCVATPALPDPVLPDPLAVA
ncbi:ATP-grasp domain-containing protein [Nocardia aurantia]|uniref:ATP-grasp domain-containing protein n=1 Tax=Nocardia aurantia TaxID=2585199 RepID=UPI001885EDE6|nr:biotin carboxylase [Nocardia aurantia]